MWRTKLTPENVRDIAKAARANYWDRVKDTARANAEPSQESLDAWQEVVASILDTAQTIGIVPTVDDLATEADYDPYDAERVGIMVLVGGRRVVTRLNLGRDWVAAHGPMAAYYLEVTVRKAAEVTVRKALDEGRAYIEGRQ